MTRKIDYKKDSIARFWNAPGRNLFEKADRFWKLRLSLQEDGIFPWRIKYLERKEGLVRVQTEDGLYHTVIDAATNDYLGLSGDPRVIKSVQEAIERFGVGAGGASMLSGNSPLHFELEHTLARFLQKESVLLSSSGYATMTAVTQGLLRPTDVVFYDRFCHASLVDGMFISGAKMYKYPHNDIASLQKLLRDYRNRYRGALIVTDGVFSTEGTVAHVQDLVTLAQTYQCRLVVDDAHGIGTLNNGKGIACYPSVDLIAGVFSKAFGSAGGFVAGDREIIEYLRVMGRAVCATSNMSVANAAGALAALKIIQSDPSCVAHLATNVHTLRRLLINAGIDTADTISPIIALTCGQDAHAYWAWKEMFDAGILTHPLPFPIVPLNDAKIRIRVNTFMNDVALEKIAAAAVDVFKPYAPKTIKRPQQYQTRVQQGFISHEVDTTYGPVVVHQRGDGESWIFLHPLLWGSEVYVELFGQYTEQNRLIAIDFWGHGQAKPTQATKITLQDIARTLHQVIAKLGLIHQTFNLVGTSLGAMIALRYAMEHPTRVKHLWLVGYRCQPIRQKAAEMAASSVTTSVIW